jgi:hypothetical protein
LHVDVLDGHTLARVPNIGLENSSERSLADHFLQLVLFGVRLVSLDESFILR